MCSLESGGEVGREIKISNKFDAILTCRFNAWEFFFFQVFNDVLLMHSELTAVVQMQWENLGVNNKKNNSF